MAQQTISKLFAAKQSKQKETQPIPTKQAMLPQDLIPWVEKYRPNTLSEVSFQDEVITIFSGILQTGDLPHTILYGPPGTGKTSSILALAKQLYGPEFRSRIIELNASDDRGISVVREKVKKFAQTLVSKKPLDKKYLFPAYKIIILDEADSMTEDAQNALRRIIEDFSTNTRFCIICNYITKIIDPLSSRCVKLRFKPISIDTQLTKLISICKQENLTYDEWSLKLIIDLANGDLRKSINMLQAAGTLNDKNINESVINDISGTVPTKLIEGLYMKLTAGNLENLIDYVDELLLDGYPSFEIINQFFDLIVGKKEIPELKRSRIMEKIAVCEQMLIEGGREDLQLRSLFSGCLLICLEKN